MHDQLEAGSRDAPESVSAASRAAIVRRGCGVHNRGYFSLGLPLRIPVWCPRLRCTRLCPLQSQAGHIRRASNKTTGHSRHKTFRIFYIPYIIILPCSSSGGVVFHFVINKGSIFYYLVAAPQFHDIGFTAFNDYRIAIIGADFPVFRAPPFGYLLHTSSSSHMPPDL